MIKRVSVLLTVVVLALNCIIFNAFAAENLTFSVSNATGYAGEEVKVNVNVLNNPGIVTFVLKLDYNSDIFTLTNVEEKNFSGLYRSELLTDMPYQIQFGDTTHGNNTTNGTIVELTFCINDNAVPGVYPIVLTCDDDAVANEDLQLLPFDTENGTITVKDSNISVDSIKVAPTEKTLTSKGETFTILPTVLPENATNKAVSFRSSNESVATVNSNGVVTAVANGTTTITAVTEDGNKTAECKVTVNIPHVHTMIKIDGKESTCIEQGNNTYYKCDICGKYFKDYDGNTETTPDNEKLPLVPHIGGNATCDHKAICDICGKEYGNYAAHKYGEWTVAKQATETEKGVKERKCSVCGHKEIAEIPVINCTDTDTTNMSDTDKKSTADTPSNSTTSSKTTTYTNNTTTGASAYAPKTGAASSVFTVITVASFALATVVVIKKIKKL